MVQDNRARGQNQMRLPIGSTAGEVIYTELPQRLDRTNWQSRVPAALQFFVGSPE